MTTADADLVIVGGGQSGLATAATALAAGLHPVLLEQSTETVGSWPRYYDSLKVFSPAGFCGLPGRRFPGDPLRFRWSRPPGQAYRGFVGVVTVLILALCGPSGSW